MMPTTLKVRENILTLPREWVEAFPTDEVAAVMLGDVLVVRPIPTVVYDPETEQRVLDAVGEFEKEREAGRLRELGDKGFDELRAEAEELERIDSEKRKKR